jgi:hypothetical protein
MTLWFSLDQIELNAMVRRFGHDARDQTPRRRFSERSRRSAGAESFRNAAVSDQASAGVEKKTAVSNS